VFERAARNDSLVDSYAQLILESTPSTPTETTTKTTKTPTPTIHIETFRKYCSSHIIISSWLRALASFPSSLQLEGGDNHRFTDNLLSLSSNSVTNNSGINHPPPAAKDLRADRALSEADHQALLLSGSAAAAAADTTKQEANDEASGDEPPAAEGAVDEAPPTALDKVKVPVDSSRWRRKVDMEEPAESPALRPDLPEDLFQLSWLCGFNSAAATAGGGGVKRCVHYHGALDKAGIVFSAANHVIHMKKRDLGGGGGGGEEEGEEGGEEGEGEADSPWQQAVYTEHTAAITSMQRLQSRRGEAANLLITADSAGAVVLWTIDSSRIRVRGRLSTPCADGVQLIDISSDGQLIAAVLKDAANTVCVYSAPSPSSASALVFSRELSAGCRPLDVQFAESSAVLGVATDAGLRFFVDEGGGCMGEGGMRMYEERAALYANVGRPALGVAVTALSKFEFADQLLCGTERGQVAVWHGRTCFQLLEDVHASAITALDFNNATSTLVVADCAGHISVFEVTDADVGAGVADHKGLLLATARMLQVSAMFDIFHFHDLYSHR
jgi:hypothetical protein